MKSANISTFLKKYTMVIVLVVVTLFFTWKTGGRMLLPQNVNNLISQNAYVFILATGMLLCILTGGNIDLSVGSIVCFVGAVGATFMVNKGMNVFVTIIIMLATGLAIGIWQGFWIAYRRIPPFIVTLAGMLMFRGLSNIVLDGFTIAPMPENYLALFNMYIVDFFHGDGLNITCLLFGIIVALIFVAVTFRGRATKVKKGYAVGPASSDIIKCAIISLVIVAFAWRLAQYKGIPYLADLNEQAQNRLQLIIKQMQEAECVNDELKEKNQMAWVQAMNSIHNRAEEIVIHELVYGEDV